MSTGLYEELGITKDATEEQIRKAYKKRALQTHPDRLPPTATAEDKAKSEENFRKANNAYEVLIDAEKRKEYDFHGVWPPPETPNIPDVPSFDNNPFAQEFFTMHSGFGPFEGQPFGDPSFGRHHHPRHFQFTDPFTLFDQIFAHVSPDLPRHHRPRGAFVDDPWGMDEDMSLFGRSPLGFGFGGGFPAALPSRSRSMFGNRMESHFHSGGSSSQMRFTAESHMTSTVNGVTQTIHKRVDADGNEIVTITYPDGREIRTVNGIEQSTGGYIANGHAGAVPQLTDDIYDRPRHSHRSHSSSRRRRHHHHHHHHHQPQPQPQPQPVPTLSHGEYDAYGAPLPPPYPGPTDTSRPSHRHHPTQAQNPHSNDRPHTYPNVTPQEGNSSPAGLNINDPHGHAHARDSRQPQTQRSWWNGFGGRH